MPARVAAGGRQRVAGAAAGSLHRQICLTWVRAENAKNIHAAGTYREERRGMGSGNAEVGLWSDRALALAVC